MRIRKPGRIHDRLWLLGRAEACVYLLEGTEGSILINGGLSFIVPDLIEQFREFDIDESKINRYLLLHSHFDHCGAVPFFKRRDPEMVVYASQRALDLFQRPKVIEAINASSHYAIKSHGLEWLKSEYELDWWTGISGEAVGDGDSIDLGGVQLRILETPGHSPCSISAYVPQLHALFPSEAAGIPYAEKILPYGTSNFIQFQNSLEKLKDLPVELICSDHWGYVTGDEARNFIVASIEEAERRRGLMQETYARTGSVDESARELATRFRDENVMNILPPELFIDSFRYMIKNVVGLKR